MIFLYLPLEIRNDREFALAALKNNYRIFKYLPREV